MSRSAEGTPYVPPNPICPSDQSGSLPDLSTTAFELNVDAIEGCTHYYAVFGSVASDECTGIYDANFVETAILTIPSSSELARQLHAVAELEGIEGTQKVASATIPSNEHPVAERMRTAFCERVANCRGVIGGECWALGASAVREVVEEALRSKES